MKHLAHAAAVAAVLFGVPAMAQAQQQPEMGSPASLRDLYGYPFGTPTRPISVTVTNSSSGSAASGSIGTVAQGAGATSWSSAWFAQIGNSFGANALGNPLFAQITNFPATQTTAPASFAPGACSSNTVGTTPTKIIDSVAAGVPRNGGGFQLSSASTAAPVVYSWLVSTNLTAATPGAFVLQPGGTISFAGAPNTALYAIVQSGSASVSGGCMTE